MTSVERTQFHVFALILLPTKEDVFSDFLGGDDVRGIVRTLVMLILGFLVVNITHNSRRRRGSWTGPLVSWTGRTGDHESRAKCHLGQSAISLVQYANYGLGLGVNVLEGYLTNISMIVSE